MLVSDRYTSQEPVLPDWSAPAMLLFLFVCFFVFRADTPIMNSYLAQDEVVLTFF